MDNEVSKLSKGAKYISAFFSPILIPTYCVALAMWITELSQLSETTRLMATVVVLCLTAIIPTACIATMVRVGIRKSIDNADSRLRFISIGTFALCLLITAWYLYSVYAPVWLVMIPVSGAGAALSFALINLFFPLSGHACGMGAMFAIVFYMGREGIADVSITPWLIVLILLSGLVGSSRIILKRHDSIQVGVGFLTGCVITYLLMNLHLFDAKIPC